MQRPHQLRFGLRITTLTLPLLLAGLACSGAGEFGGEAEDATASGGGGTTGGVGGDGSGVGGSSGGSPALPTSGGSGGIEGPWPPSATFTNPVLWEDLADAEVIRVGDVFYYTASNMHYSPGAPILRSYDLVNWEYAGHAVPVLDFAAKYDLNGGRAYVKGTWASTLTHRASNDTFYFLACIEFSKSYVWTASAVDGAWTKHPAINNCYYDAGLLVDDDDTMYVAYGNTTISVARLSADGFSEVEKHEVFQTPGNIGTLEGARFYKISGKYYIFLTRPPNGQFILRSDDPFGPYELHTVVDNVGAPVGGAGAPHQGALVQTQGGDWYYMGFIDAFPGGRVPVLAPVTWSDGWPVVGLVDGKWGASYPFPDVPRPPRAMKSSLGKDSFDTPQLGHEWEWNHNPDNTKWSAGGGLTLQTATVTSDLYAARNTLTRRIRGPSSTATIELDYAGMKDGDVAGLAMFRQSSAWIGIKKAGGAARVVQTTGLTMNTSWATTGTGSEAASANVSGGKIWLRVQADISPGSGKQAKFFYSTDGTNFTQLGAGFTLNDSWEYFMGYRFALFDYATTSLGGSVKIPSFTISSP